MRGQEEWLWGTQIRGFPLMWNKAENAGCWLGRGQRRCGGMRGSERRRRSTGWVWGERDGAVKARFPFPGMSIWAHRRTLFIKTGTDGPRLGADIQKRSFEHKHFEVPMKFPTEAANGEFNILAAIQATSRAGIENLVAVHAWSRGRSPA